VNPPKIVLVGVGHLGTYHLEKLMALCTSNEVQIAAVVDVDPERLAKAAARCKSAAFASLDDVNVHADAAIVATPTPTHVDVALKAMQRGWHVLVEKPLASTSQEAQQLVEAAQQHGLVLQVGHSERFNPAVEAVMKMLDNPRYIVAERLGPFTGRSTETDVVLDLMIHDLDIVASLVPAALTEVRAIGVPVITEAVDMAAARLAFADGTVAQLSAGRASLEPSRKIRFFTQERYVSVDCATQQVKSIRRLAPAKPGEHPQITGEPVEINGSDALMAQLASFVRCITEGSTPRVDGAAGVRALKLAEAVREALDVPAASGGD
jgi:predicted dehydrogenase